MSVLTSPDNSANQTPWYSRIKHPALWAGCVIILGMIINNILMGKFGQIGPDSDDALRLVQIKDYLAGQSWFHTDQYRLGLAGGTDMHWSRLPDIPIVLFTRVFDLFLPQELALKLAFFLWPPMSAGILMAALFTGAKHWEQQKTKIFTMVLLAFFVFVFFRFRAGSIDHHNVQLGFVALSMGFALDPQMRLKSYFISGLAIAISLAIGVEVYVFAAIICIFIALNWALKGREVFEGTQGFGLGLSVGLIATFLATVSRAEYSLIYCDALSLITVMAGAVGGVGLAGLAVLGSRTRIFETFTRRLLGLMVLGGACMALLSFQAPQCLANPLDALPEEVVSLWLSGIEEAKSLFEITDNKATTIPIMIAAPLLAICILLREFRSFKFNREGLEAIWGPKILIFMLLLAGISLTIYQIRFYPFAYVFAILPLAAWVARVFTEGKKANPSSVAYLGALTVSIPFMWAVPGILFGGGAEDLNEKAELLEKAESCASDDVLKSLNNLPRGLLVANANLAAPFLLKTEHHVMSGNYHRNWKGITTQIHIAISEPEKAYQLLTDSSADYLHYCKFGAETPDLIRHNEKGLYAQIHAGNIPEYLEPLSGDELGEGDIKIFRFNPSDGAASNPGGQ